MTTTPVAKKKMRVAALGLSTALTVGALAPFIGTSSASALDCSTANASYSHASAKLAADKAKLHRAKKKLKKAKRHHKSHAVIRHDKRRVIKLKHKVHHDRNAVNYAAGQRSACSNGGSTTTPGGGTNPLSQLATDLSPSSMPSLTPTELANALGQVADQVRANGSSLPGSTQFADALDQLAQAIAQNSSSFDPQQFKTALSDALAQGQAELQAAAANPSSMTAQMLVDDILNPMITGLTNAGAPQQLQDALNTLKTNLDQVLAQFPTMGSVPGAGTLPVPGA